MARFTRTGRPRSLAQFYDDLASAPNLISDDEPLFSGASAVPVDLTVYQTKITTGGTAGSEDVTLGDGTGTVTPIVGQQHLITLETRTNASDVVNLDHANMVDSAGTDLTNMDLDAAGEFVLVRWTGTKWKVLETNGTLATA